MKKHILFLGLAVVFALSLCCGFAEAAETRASITLSLFPISVSKGSPSSGEIKITYDVRASQRADEVGISSIKIYTSDDIYVTTITGSAANGLIAANTVRHNSMYTYKGTSGFSYYAVVTVFATVGSDSDSRVVQTDVVKAP